MRMKKALLALMILGLAAASASAGIKLSWDVSYGAYTHDAPNVSDDPSSYQLLDFYSVTWQLIYAGADDAANAFDLGNSGAGWVSGDDVVWATRTIAMGGGTAPQDGTSWSDWMLLTGGDAVYQNYVWSNPGDNYVFQRVFEGSPAELSWYFENDLELLDEHYVDGSPDLPQVFSVETGAAGFQPDQQIPAAPVPEPATMGLLGLGALAMAIRRRRS
jgi:hypothetical protein